jgi:DNA gyrase subunit A
MTVTERNGDLLAVFPVEEADQIMLVTDGGTLIRCPIDDIRIAGRNTQGVTIFKTEEDAKVVSVAHLADASGDDDVEEGTESAEIEGAVVETDADGDTGSPQTGEEE